MRTDKPSLFDNLIGFLRWEPQCGSIWLTVLINCDSMERVLYNTIAGATPILADGTSFYYSDYNHEAHKVHYRDKWPCCSGTFPQLTADYGISSYYKSDDGLYVNLFVPSRVSWSQNNTQCTLTQRTEYPRQSTTQFDFALARPETFTVYLRIPAWAGPKTTLAVNGTRISDAIEPGKFLPLKRAWKDRDRIELEFDIPLRLEAIDDQDRENVALMRGPLALFGRRWRFWRRVCWNMPERWCL